MKQIISVAFIGCTILFSSCESYVQLYCLDSKNVKKIDNSFVFENDTVKITYSFWANRGVLAFDVFNKLEKPIYVDWKKSSFIYKEQKLNFWDDNEMSTTVGLYKDYLYTGPTPYYSYNKLIGTGVYGSATTKTKPERITFIPPKSGYKRSQFFIYNSSGIKLPFSAKQIDYNDNSNINSTVKAFAYTSLYNDTNQVKDLFRNFLTFSVSEDISTEFHVDNSFFIKSIYEFIDYDFSTIVNNGLSTDDKFYIVIPEENSIMNRK